MESMHCIFEISAYRAGVSTAFLKHNLNSYYTHLRYFYIFVWQVWCIETILCHSMAFLVHINRGQLNYPARQLSHMLWLAEVYAVTIPHAVIGWNLSLIQIFYYSVCILKVVTYFLPSQASMARSGGVSRSDCRHVMKITTPYESRALIWDLVI